MGNRVADRSPDINDAVASFQESLCLISEMVLYALSGSTEGLVNMNSLHWATQRSLGRASLIYGAPSDGVVENEDPLGSCMLLQDLLNLCIVNCLDPLLVDEIFLVAWGLHKLKPAYVKAQGIFLAPGVMNDDGAGVLADVGPWYTYGRFVDVVVSGLVVGRCIIVEAR